MPVPLNLNLNLNLNLSLSLSLNLPLYRLSLVSSLRSGPRPPEGWCQAPR